jgi:hypothetical protein
MAKDRDVNDILREEGEEAVRAFHDDVEPFDESNPKFQNGKRERMAREGQNGHTDASSAHADKHSEAGRLRPRDLEEFLAASDQAA